MSPRTLEQNEKIKKEKELLIIETALFRFSEDGFKSTSMQSVAKEAQVSKGNLYNYFESKEELLKSVLEHGLNKFSDFFSELKTETLSEHDFEKMILKNFDILKSNKSFWKLYFNLVSQASAQKYFAEIMEPFMEAYMEFFVAYFSNKGDDNPSATSLLLGSSIDGISLGYLMMGESYPLDEVVKKLIEKFK